MAISAEETGVSVSDIIFGQLQWKQTLKYLSKLYPKMFLPGTDKKAVQDELLVFLYLVGDISISFSKYQGDINESIMERIRNAYSTNSVAHIQAISNIAVDKIDMRVDEFFNSGLGNMGSDLKSVSEFMGNHFAKVCNAENTAVILFAVGICHTCMNNTINYIRKLNIEYRIT